MNEFNLKKRNVRRKAYFDKNSLLAKNGSDLINDKLKFISIKIFDLLDKKRKHSGSKMNSGHEFKLSCRNFFDFSKFSSKFEPTVI